MPPDNRRSHPFYDAWCYIMRLVWQEHPTITFIASRGNDIVAIGGFIRPAMDRPANDSDFVYRPPQPLPPGEAVELPPNC